MADQASPPSDAAREPVDDIAANGTLDPIERHGDELGSHGDEPRSDSTTDATASAAEQHASDQRPAADDNLLGELARAMHAAASAQYERLNADLERRRAEQVEVIAARTASEIETLKADSETDIGSIEMWAKSEIEKIKLERLRRIDARREELAGQLERQDTIKEREVFAIEVAIDAYRNEVDLFFGRMERETDPAAIAGVAATMPAFPSLADVAEEARRGAAAEFASLEQEGASGQQPKAESEAPPEAVSADAPTGADATERAAASAAETQPAAVADATTATATATEGDGAAAGATTATTDAPTAEVEAAAAGGEPAQAGAPLQGVMDPAATRGETDAAQPWEAPYAVSVAAGTGPAEDEPAPMSVGSTLLRTVRSIRPMAGRHDKDSGEGNPSH